MSSTSYPCASETNPPASSASPPCWRGVSGTGQSNSFELVRGNKRVRVLDIVATRQRHLENRSRCKRPEPTKHRYVFDRKRNTFV